MPASDRLEKESQREARKPDGDRDAQAHIKRRRLGRSLPIAPQIEVSLAQPAVPNFLVNAGLSGGRFETAPLLDRCEKPDTCR